MILITICCVLLADTAASELEPDGLVPLGTAAGTTACAAGLDPVDLVAVADLVGLGGSTGSSGISSISSSCLAEALTRERLFRWTAGEGGGGIGSGSARGALMYCLLL